MNKCEINYITLAQLQYLTHSLDRNQKSSIFYINGNERVFPRFYFISDDDLLSILGLSQASTNKSHMITLFDKFKYLCFDRSNKIIKLFSDEGIPIDFF